MFLLRSNDSRGKVICYMWSSQVLKKLYKIESVATRTQCKKGRFSQGLQH